MTKILYQGHGSLRLVSDKGTVVYIDPYAGDGYDLPADIILISHEHGDHNQVSLVTIKENTKIFRPENMLVNGEYQTELVDDIVIKAVPAGNNPNHSIDSCVGFLVAVDTFKLYFAGDTSATDYMKEELPKMELDYIFLPIDGKYNMGPEEAAECANAIKAKYTIPIHMAPGKLFDREAAEQLKVDNRLILEAGEKLRLFHCSGCCGKN